MTSSTDIVCPMYARVHQLIKAAQDGMKEKKGKEAKNEKEAREGREGREGEGERGKGEGRDGGLNDRPLILCEYSHAMGNSNGNLHKYWHAFESHPNMWGGFLWDWVDQGLTVQEEKAEEEEGERGERGEREGERERESEKGEGEGEGGMVRAFKYGGDYGECVHDGPFCINGLLFPNRNPHPALYECKSLQSPFKLSLATFTEKEEKGEGEGEGEERGGK